MNEKKITGVRVYVITVDSETNTVLKCEEEDPNTRHRTELDPNFKVVPIQYPAPETPIPAGFVPSIVILVGGQVPAMSQGLQGGEQMKHLVRSPTPPTPTPTPRPAPKKPGEDKQADKGEPPKV
jgi:hypothetical protein